MTTKNILGKLNSPLEVLSLENEIARLYAYAEVLHETHEHQLKENEAQSNQRHLDLSTQHEKTNKLLRDDFVAQVQMKDLELTKLQALLTTVEASQRLDLHQDLAELRKNLSDSESNWSKSVVDRERQHSEALVLEKTKFNEVSNRLASAVITISELESALRRVLKEKEELESYIQLEPTRWSAAQRSAETDRRHLQTELTARQAEIARLREHLHQYEDSNLRRDRAGAERIELLEMSLAEEKRRNDQLVVVFSEQVDTLHEQLAAAMAKNARLLSESERSQRNQ